MESTGLNIYDLRLLKYLYYNPVEFVQVEHSTNQIKRGVQQGHILSPTIFKLYSEDIFKESLNNRRKGVKIGRDIIYSIRCVDDKCILAENLEDIQTLITLVNQANRKGKQRFQN